MIYILEQDDYEGTKTFVECDHEDGEAVERLLLAMSASYLSARIIGTTERIAWREPPEEPQLWQRVSPRFFYTSPQDSGRGDDSAPEDPTGRILRWQGQDPKPMRSITHPNFTWTSKVVPDQVAHLKEDVFAAATTGLMAHLLLAWKTKLDAAHQAYVRGLWLANELRRKGAEG